MPHGTNSGEIATGADPRVGISDLLAIRLAEKLPVLDLRWPDEWQHRWFGWVEKILTMSKNMRFEMRCDGQLVCGMTIAKRPENDAELAILLKEVIAMLEAPDVLDGALMANEKGQR